MASSLEDKEIGTILLKARIFIAKSYQGAYNRDISELSTKRKVTKWELLHGSY